MSGIARVMRRPRLMAALLCLSPLLLPFLFPSFEASGQAYPTKPVRIVVPYPPGGPYDELARVVGQRLTETWGHPVIVENRSGAGGNIGAEYVVKSQPDGHMLLLANAGLITINVSLLKNLPYDPQKDLAAVTQLLATPMVLMVHPSLPVRSVRELVTLAKSRPGRLNYASTGVGNVQHIGMELLQSMARINMNHVPYKGGAPAFVDLIGGQVELMFGNIVGTLPHLKSARVRAISVSSAKRTGVLPDVPAIAETYPGFDITSWSGLFVPAATPREIVAKVSMDVGRVLGRPDIRDRFAAQGAEALPGSPEQLAALVRRDTALYARVIRDAGIRAD